MDYVCRYGGEEFAILMPRTDRKESLLIAEKLRQDVERFPFIHEATFPGRRLTVSIGIGSFPENGASAAELITSADKALYQAKHKGKNNTCCY
jgi:diguanylate cyclase (GGDEF)-like protein